MSPHPRGDPDATPRRHMQPERRGYRRIWLQEATKRLLVEAASAAGCKSIEQYLMLAHECYQATLPAK